jgi:hypothetical protein
VWAEINGKEYVPGGTKEIDELMDLDFIWNPPEPKALGYSANMMDDD